MPGTAHREVDLRGPGNLLAWLLKQTRAIASDYARLAVLDARGAAIRFAWLVSMGMIVSVLVVTAWLGFLVAGVEWLIGPGTSWTTVLAVAAAINLAVAGILAYRMRRLTVEMPFAATLRQIDDDTAGHDQGRDARARKPAAAQSQAG